MSRKTPGKMPPTRATKEIVHVYKIQFEGLSELAAALVSLIKLSTASLGQEGCKTPAETERTSVLAPTNGVVSSTLESVDQNGSKEESPEGKKSRSKKESSKKGSKQDGVLAPPPAPINGIEVFTIPPAAETTALKVESPAPVKPSTAVDVFDFGDS